MEVDDEYDWLTVMEVDDEYDWLTVEAGYKLVEGPLPVSERQQQKDWAPQSIYRASIALKL